MTDLLGQPLDGYIQDTLALTIADAVEASEMAIIELDATVRHAVSSKSGIEEIFAKTREAVSNTEPGNIGRSVFDAAMRAATDAVTCSSIHFSYDRIRKIAILIPDHLIWMAARQAANDMFAKIPVKPETSGDKRLRGRMRTAAVRAVRTRIKQDDGILAAEAAAKEAQYVAENTIRMTSDIILIGASVHAATAALFRIAIQDAPSAGLTDAILEACEELPDMARRHSDTVVGLVTALSMTISAEAGHRRKYQTAVRSAEKVCQDEATTQIINMITENAFEMIYTVLVIGAYATSDGTEFESGYEKALADIYKIDARQIRLAKMGGIPEDLEGGVPMEVFLDMLLSSEDVKYHQRMFKCALNVDYKTTISNSSMDGIISLYEMAYRVGYEKAQDIAAKATGGSLRGK